MTDRDRERLAVMESNCAATKRMVEKIFDRMEGENGFNERLTRIETSHAECMARQKTPKQWPSVVSAICAICAFVASLIAWRVSR